MNNAWKILAGAACAIAGCCMVFMYAMPVCKMLQGEAIVLHRTGSMKTVVSGRTMDCPCFVVRKGSLPRKFGNLHAFQLGTNSTTAVVCAKGDLYWLDGNGIGMTRCNPIGDMCLILNRWLILSETALNLTYDVQNDMKGLKNAVVQVVDRQNEIVYRCRFHDAGGPKDISFHVPRKSEWQRGAVPKEFR